MASLIPWLLILGWLLLFFGVPIGLGILLSNVFRVRDLRPRICLILLTIFWGFAPFLVRMVQLDSFTYQREDASFVSAEKVQDGQELDTKKPVREVLLPPRQIKLDGDVPILATDKNIRLAQRWTFDWKRGGEALKYGIDLAGGTNLIYQAEPLDANEPITSEVMTRLVGAVMKRVNPAGTNEVIVRQVGQDRIEVIVPGADPATVEAVKLQITKLGNLEFAIVCNTSDHGGSASAKVPFDIMGAAKSNPDAKHVQDETGIIVAEWLPVAPERDAEGKEKGPNRREFQLNDPKIAVRQRKDQPEGYYEVLVLRLPQDRRVTGGLLRSAKPDIDRNGNPAVAFTFNSEGAARFEDLTREYRSTAGVDRRLAVVLDGYVHNAASIKAVISTNGIIENMGSQKDVQELTNVLNAGALPVSLSKLISQFTVSPTLGEDVKQKGIRALWISAVVVIAFMAAYYLVTGLVADFVMLLNLLFIAAAMSLVDAAFTLPGLAGLVLGAGMAVDTNVLIYERMREELQRGASLRMAIHTGFDRAFTAIIDSHLTTIISSVILYAIGTEQVKGFAVTLLIGLVMNLYTAVFISRVILTIMERARLVKSFPMLQMIGKTNVDFIAMRHLTALGSIVLIVAGLAAFVARGKSNYDIDFNGGSMVTMLFNQDMETDTVRSTLAGVKELGGDITLERLTLPGEAVQGTLGRRFRLRTTVPEEKLVETQVAQVFADKLVRISMSFGEIKPIPPAEKPKASEKKDADKKDADKKDDKQGKQPDLTAEQFAGGREAQLNLSSQGKEYDVAPSTIARYLTDELQKLGVKDAESLFVIEGLAGAGTTAAEGDVKLYHTMRVRTASTLTADQLKKSLTSVQQVMEQKPVFDEVTTFATSVADEAKMWAVISIVASLVALIIYIWFRFETVIFGIAAIVAVFHDVLVALGCLALGSYLSMTPIGPLLLLTDFKINMAIVAAFLTIVGYSLNDTIVIFDRLREIRGKAPTVTRDMINLSVNQCMSRTILTTLTVLLSVIILYVFGGEGIHGFAFTMLTGCIAGTYSTIFIANPIVLWLTERWHTASPAISRVAKPTHATT